MNQLIDSTRFGGKGSYTRVGSSSLTSVNAAHPLLAGAGTYYFPSYFLTGARKCLCVAARLGETRRGLRYPGT